MLSAQKCLLRLIYLILIVWSGPSAQSQKLPPIRHFNPSTYGADNQNWQASQGADGYTYFANNKGLLSYNGAQWHLHPSPNETILRSVEVIDSLIYTGAHMDFGVWEKNEFGNLNYTSLKDQLNVSMLEGEQIWKIVAYKGKVLFQSLNGIYVYNIENSTIRYISVSSKNSLFRLFVLEDDLFFQKEGVGLFTISEGKAIVYDKRQEFIDKTFVGLFKRDGYWLGVSEKSGIYKITPSEIVPWEHEGAEVLKGKTIYRSVELSDDGIGIGTIASGFIQLTKQGALAYEITQDRGLGNNTVLSIYEDRFANIWVGLDNGISCINTSAPIIRNYRDQKGRLGTTYASALYEDDLYIGTNQGLFYKEKDAADFVFIQGTQGQVWTLEVINGELFCGHNDGTFLVKKERLTQVADVEGTWSIRQVPSRSDLLIQGNYDGLYILKKEAGTWSASNKLEGFNISSRYFEFVTPHKILVNNEYKGVYEVEVDSAFAKATTYTLDPSVSKGEHSSLVSFEGDIYYGNKYGIFKYDADAKSFQKDNHLSAIYADEYVTGKLVNDGYGNLWAFTRREVVYFTKDNLEKDLSIQQIAVPQGLRNVVKGFENIQFLNDQEFLLGTVNGFLIISLDRSERIYEIAINRVELKERSGKSEQVSLHSQGDFKAKQNNISFDYAVAQYHAFKQTDYQYRLKGFYDTWSNWSPVSTHEFTNIPAGEFTFQVRARVGNTLTVNSGEYVFSIRSPWYKSNTAIVLYILLGVLGFAAIQVYNKRRYKNEQQRLLEKTKRELDLKALAVEKENIELRNQNLRNDIQARNRELATSTLAMVKKSKTLKTLKEKLLKLEPSKEIQEIIKEIDRNISTNEDWSFFEKAFNHADKDFFKKVKEIHPELTANDLKLCVYLRLNLSSKEIAPLLNISHRSVEIKRYRLRKKINLDRSVQLNEYFIGL